MTLVRGGEHVGLKTERRIVPGRRPRAKREMRTQGILVWFFQDSHLFSVS